ncbi:unnamed protein product [Adineta steineri]|uniref:U-box domain-containing protein n=1 Tax=Adineta steineri TaxID=433720 RepID=A0A815HAN5_9BILA|nr:unnamed protein product [Adineta steineri]CAF3607632.1 unnamed protein product [Adineta steineri]
MSNTLSLQTTCEDAKHFRNFTGILMAISLHPEWLVKIPEGRAWAILHHVVYSGEVNQLEQLLALQKSNTAFRLLSPTSKNETVLDIAKLRPDQKEMLQRIERLVKLDEMLAYAKDCEWDKCYSIIEENPSYGNEKPPYRRFYLIHHIAADNNIEQFKIFKKIQNFKFDVTLRADRKKINIIAREEGSNVFADYIEQEYSSYFDDDEIDDQLYEPSDTALQQTNKINVLMEQHNIFQDSNFNLGPAEIKKPRRAVDAEVEKTQPKPKQASNQSQSGVGYSVGFIQNLLKCSLTGFTVTDPVVAADGFTYERSAIENWFKKSDCSPMTNEKLAHKNLNPNLIVKQILNSIARE